MAKIPNYYGGEVLSNKTLERSASLRELLGQLGLDPRAPAMSRARSQSFRPMAPQQVQQAPGLFDQIHQDNDVANMMNLMAADDARRRKEGLDNEYLSEKVYTALNNATNRAGIGTPEDLTVGLQTGMIGPEARKISEAGRQSDEDNALKRYEIDQTRQMQEKVASDRAQAEMMQALLGSGGRAMGMGAGMMGGGVNPELINRALGMMGQEPMAVRDKNAELEQILAAANGGKEQKAAAQAQEANLRQKAGPSFLQDLFGPNNAAAELLFPDLGAQPTMNAPVQPGAPVSTSPTLNSASPQEWPMTPADDPLFRWLGDQFNTFRDNNLDNSPITRDFYSPSLGRYIRLSEKDLRENPTLAAEWRASGAQ